jgi:hypothetical protein
MLLFDFVMRGELVDDLAERLSVLKTFPNDHGGLVQLKITFCVEIDEDALAAIEISDYDMLAGDEIS